MEKVLCHTRMGDVAIRDSQGSGFPVILVHGNSLSAKTFEPQLAGEPGQRWRMLAIDLPGHGDSPPSSSPRATYCFEGYAAVVRDVADHFHLREPALVGHSLGGHIALQTAASGFDTRGVIVVGTPPLRGRSDLPSAFSPATSEGLFFRGRLSDAEIARAAALCMPPGVNPPSLYEECLRHTDPRARDEVGRAIAEGTIYDEKAQVARLGARAAVVIGELDQSINVSYVVNLGIPTVWRGQAQVIPGAGHCPQYDDPVAFNALLMEFLAELPR